MILSAEKPESLPKAKGIAPRLNDTSAQLAQQAKPAGITIGTSSDGYAANRAYLSGRPLRYKRPPFRQRKG